jgi:hypothetical protein
MSDSETPQATDADQWKRRYNYLLNMLIEKGVLTNTQYSNGTWVLRGIYGIDDSGLMGAGRSPEEAIDNSITMATLTARDAEKLRQEINKGIK